ncbi:cupin domain-containing protein [Rhizobium sp. CFBP 8762]|uniref:cupin domain-containing protein n=1 Tax=Rhizobium sp. CFBP 8762 TaxID=2775279 RepID=UPI00177BD5CF|nr:cupin domain-containing protein [Rhizobium sp. CFBP 8762]MBD8556453.1 cupin domain-containing protein [Rhizobium sp. CFBP 8762]
MSLITRIETNPKTALRESRPTPERLISGDPSFNTWPQDASRDDTVHTGIWEATPGETHSIKGTTFEFCHLISGYVEITEKDGETFTFKAGDSFVMKPGFVGVWRTIETVRKIYVTATDHVS